jgi:prepilin-type N-terminal cleavage/methylation domain-containing protein
MKQRSAGFTLIEVLIALALSGIVALLLLEGVRVATIGLDRLSDRAERLEARRTLEDLLRRELGGAFAAPLAPNLPALVGHATNMHFLTLAEDAGAGLYQVELGLDKAGALSLNRRRVGAAGEPQASLLLRHPQKFEIAYFGAPSQSDPPQWWESWDGPRFPPRLVRIILDAGDGIEHPPIIVRLWSAAS